MSVSLDCYGAFVDHRVSNFSESYHQQSEDFDFQSVFFKVYFCILNLCEIILTLPKINLLVLYQRILQDQAMQCNAMQCHQKTE